MVLKIIIEPDEDRFAAYCPQLPGCVSYGTDRRDAWGNIQEAIELYLRPIPQIFDHLSTQAEIMEIAV